MLLRMHKTVYLIRHAQSHPSASIPEPQWPLSQLGLQQAIGLVGVLQPLGIKSLHSSPYLRCIQTITPFVEHTGLVLQQHDGLHERTLSKTLVDDFMSLWKRSWDDFGFALPGCESNRDAQQRFVQTVQAIVASVSEQTIGICAHGAVIGLLLHALDPTVDRSVPESLRNPDVLRLDIQEGEWVWDRSFDLPALETLVSQSSDTPVDRH